MTEPNPMILIVEDDIEMAHLNARFLKRNGYEVEVASTVFEARLLMKACSPELVVLDIGLPDGDGLDFCNELRESSDLPVLFLTGRTEIADKVAGLNAGGDYYLTKPFDRDEFLAVVQSLLRRSELTKRSVDAASLLTVGAVTIDMEERHAILGEYSIKLTPMEFNLLLVLMRNAGKELSHEEIYRSVWGVEMGTNSGALRQLVFRLKRKLGEEDSEHFAIINEQGKGYAFIVR